jgi:putative flavoprotein involved in K+ transport
MTIDTVIIGGGQAGLALGYHLARQSRDFVILDANARVGDAWRHRWDSLRLFTPVKFDGLPGMPMPGDPLAFPTKDELADYIEDYARHFGLPVRTGVRVDRLSRAGDHYDVTSGEQRWLADNVVVATGSCQTPRKPPFADQLSAEIVQLHSHSYRTPDQLAPGDVLVVGLGNSGAEIALELSRTHRTWIAGQPSGELPIRHGRMAARTVLPVIRFLGTKVLTLDTPIGRKAAAAFHSHGAPLIRTKRRDLARAGVQVVPRVTGIQDGLPVVGDGKGLEVANVVWCTGFWEDFSWVDLPVFDDQGRPRQYRGVVESAPGLYFLGLEFLFRATSGTLPGVGRDAEYLAQHIAGRPTQEPSVERTPVSAEQRLP